MRTKGLRAKKRRRGRSLTKPDPAAPKFANLLQRDFKPVAMNLSWVGDITEIEAWDGKLYLDTVIDLWSRRLIGFALADNCKAPLARDALRMAIATRGGPDVIAHSLTRERLTGPLLAVSSASRGAIRARRTAPGLGSCCRCRRLLRASRRASGTLCR
jgi:transposase InsO family protein